MSVYAGPNTTQDGLVLHIDPSNPRSYPGTGNTIFDITKNGNNGTLINGASVISRGGGRALDFDGTNDEVTFGNISQLDTASSLTVSLFYRPANTSNLSGIVKQWKVTTTQAGIYLFQNNAALSWQVGNSLNTRLTTGSVLTANTWHSIVCTKTASSMEVFVNGISVASVAAAGSNDSGSQAFNLGSNLGGLDFAIAQMDDIRIYNRALTAAEIRQNFNATRARFGI